MTAEIEESYRHCGDVARRRAKNFYYSFLLLDKPRRDAMCALYAFNRRCDDLTDGPAVAGRKIALEGWRDELDRAMEGDYSAEPLWPAFHDAVERFRIPRRYFHEMIDGVMSDLEPRRIGTFDELYRYCYHVASVVGLSVVHIFGFRSEEALPLAEKCGVAFQLTNILRDVREDAAMERIYLPAQDLERFGVEPVELLEGKGSEAFRALMRFEAERAWSYYREAAPLVGMVDGGSRGSLWALIRIYSRLLERIEASNYDVLRRRIRVPSWEKVGILLRGLGRR